MSLFDTAKLRLHDLTAGIFGETAAWTPSEGGVEETAMVNFNAPDKAFSIGSLDPIEWEFTALDTWMEYRVGQFPTLKSAVDRKLPEQVRIKNTDYHVRKVVRTFDGDTFKAQLVPVL
jgi:hypothetical protein